MYEQKIEYYQDDDSLVSGLANFFHTGLEKFEPGIIIASQGRRLALESKLLELGVDLEPAIQFGQLTLLDASQTLSYFVSEEGQVRPDLFNQVVGSIVADALKQNSHVRIYQELDSVLGASNPESRLELHSLWKNLGKYRNLVLYKPQLYAAPARPEPRQGILIFPQPKFA